jgi:hypothetical protein
MEAVAAIKYFKDFMEEETDDSCLMTMIRKSRLTSLFGMNLRSF